MNKKKILLIDDEEDFLKITQLNLEGTGRYEVRTESRGSFGLSIAKAFKPDLIFLDILMMDMEGGEVAYRLQNDAETKDIPIVFLTALIQKKEIEQSQGFIKGHRFIAKPVSIEELIDCIEKTLSKN